MPFLNKVERLSSGVTSNIFLSLAMQCVAFHAQLNALMVQSKMQNFETRNIYFDTPRMFLQIQGGCTRVDEKTPNHCFGFSLTRRRGSKWIWNSRNIKRVMDRSIVASTEGGKRLLGYLSIFKGPLVIQFRHPWS